MRTINSSTSLLIRGRPGLRRFCEPSNLRATSLRYHARMVSGRAAVATSPSALRPSRRPISPSFARSASENFSRPFNWPPRIRFSAARYSFGSRPLAECLATQSTANLAELRSLCVRELQPPLQLAPQNPVFSSQILVPQQQLMVHRPSDVGQDTCPLHKSPLCARRSARAPLIAPKNLVDDTRRGYAGMG